MKVQDPMAIRSGSLSLKLGAKSNRDRFKLLLFDQLRMLGNKLRTKDEPSTTAWGLDSQEELNEQLARLKKQIEKCTRMAEAGATSQQQNPLYFRLRNAFLTGSERGLATELKYSLLDSVVTSRHPTAISSSQKGLADLRHPIEWYPATRAMHRTVHLHVGPTNSGKTYHALKKLEAAESGVYAGPLRLLAHEVYTRLNALGKKCALITGEERRIPEDMGPTMNSCTVEMVPLNTTVDVAVIDEIQMMGDTDRGWAWTQAFLGVKAREVHLCGELRTVELVTELCKKMGDKLVVHRYERLSPLAAEKQSINNDLTKLQKGDAVILFSRKGIHAMKSAIEKRTGKRCAVVYGSLPPETRAQQAALFNDPDNDYDFLAASDAVGMGLNLSIKRVIFETTTKHDGSTFREIQISEIKQIAGRAGRFKTAHDAVKAGVDSTSKLDLMAEPNQGFVTTLDRQDLPIVTRALESEVESLKTAGIFPPSDTLIRFASYFPEGTPFSYIVLRLHDLAVLDGSFQMCRLKEQLEIADLIQPYKLTIFDRITFTGAPVSLREPGFSLIVQEFAKCVADQSGGELLDLETVRLDLLEDDIHAHQYGSKGYLRDAEVLHKALTLYLWLSYRFPGVFRSQALAFYVKSLVEEKIDQCLGELQWNEGLMRRQNILRRKAAEEFQASADELKNELSNEDETLITNPRESESSAPEVNAASDSVESEVSAADSNKSPDVVISSEKADFEPEAWPNVDTEDLGSEEGAHDSEDSSASEAGVPVPLDSALEGGPGGELKEGSQVGTEEPLIYNYEKAENSLAPAEKSPLPLDVTESEKTKPETASP